MKPLLEATLPQANFTSRVLFQPLFYFSLCVARLRDIISFW